MMAASNEECGVSVGDRVVWLSEDYPEFGWVRWTGKLSGPGDPVGWMVGVEFVSFKIFFIIWL